MGQLKGTQIVNNSLTGASFDRNFKLYDETEQCIKGDIRIWQDKHWICIQDLPQGYFEYDLSHSPDLEPDYWEELVDYEYERYEFESFAVYAPTTVSNLRTHLQNEAVRIKDNFSSYNKFLFDFHSNTKDIKGKQFSTENDLVTFINNNFTSNLIVRVYALIDKSKINIHTIRGKNNAYGVIKGRDVNGRGNYYKSRVGADSTWDYIDDFSVDILERITGVTPSSVSLAKNAIWFQRNEKMYKLYTNNSKQIIKFEGGVNGIRRKFNPYTNSFTVVNSTDVFSIIPGSNAFYKINTNSSNWSYVANQKIPNDDYFQPLSFVKVYGLRDQYKNIAVMVKPVGMDEFRLNFFEQDLSNYNFYVGYYSFDNKLKIYKMVAGNDYDIENDINANNSIKIRKKALTRQIMNPDGMSVKKIVFFYGDNEGKISEFSSSVSFKYKDRGATFIPLLDRRGKY